MPELEYKDLKSYLKGLKKDEALPVYLIHGEEFLYKTACDDLLNILVPGSERKFNYEQVDGVDGNVFDITDNLNTFSFLSKAKVVAYTDAKVFYSTKDHGKVLDKVKAANNKSDTKKAAKLFVNLLSLLSLSLDDLDGKNKYKALKIDPDSEDFIWLDPIIDFCKDNDVAIPVSRDNAKILQNAVEKGFPGKNRLVVTTDMVDKRKGLYKTIKEKGMVINCSVPQGNRMADKKAQEKVLHDCMKSILSKTDKQLDPSAYGALVEITGFDLRTFANNLEKLVNYVGEDNRITIEHVHTILKRTKKDPIFELTGAISDRNIFQSLFYLESLLSNELFPLQILSAMTKQIRKLMIVKDFTQSSYGKVYRPGMPFNQFKIDVMPAVIAYDKSLQDKLEEWEHRLSKGDDAAQKGKKKKAPSDLYVVSNPNNPYPVFQMLLKSDNFSIQELQKAFEVLGQADMRLKTTGMDQKLILEDSIIHICRREAG